MKNEKNNLLPLIAATGGFSMRVDSNSASVKITLGFHFIVDCHKDITGNTKKVTLKFIKARKF